MQCLCPIKVKNKYVGLRSPYQYHVVPCGKCEACVKTKASNWYVRLKLHQKFADYCCFVTLTYNDDYLPVREQNGRIYSDVIKKDVIDYHKRLRKSLSDYERSNFKYFLTAEYGPNPMLGVVNRPHYHAIYFGIPPVSYHKIQTAWSRGFVTISEVTDSRLRYVSGYVIEKLFVPDGCKPVFNLVSKGISSAYIKSSSSYHSDITRAYIPLYGVKYPMPRYIKERVFNEGQRRLLSEKYSKEAESRLDEKISKMGFAEYERYAESVRSDFVRQVRKKRNESKRKNL